MLSTRIKTHLIAYVLFLGACACYLYYVFPSAYGGDTGELIISAHTLGIPHAPGYPLYNLIGKIAEIFFSFGNTAYRINFLSALLGAATLVLFFQIMHTLTGSRGAALGAAVYLAGIPVFFEQSILAEVFMLNAFFLLAVLWCIQHKNRIRYVYCGAFLFGLALGNHHTIVLSVPALHCVIEPRKKTAVALIYLAAFMVVFFNRFAGIGVFTAGMISLYIKYPPPRLFWPAAAKSMLWFLAGFSVYAYLPIRAAANPVMNFGDPDSLKKFIDVFTRREFGSMTLHPTALKERTGASWWAQIIGFMETCYRQIGMPGMLCAIGGVWAAVKRKAAAMPALLLLVPGLLFIMYANLSPNTLALWRLERFYLVAVIAAAVFFGFGLSSIFSFLASAEKIKQWCGVSIIIVFIIAAVASLSRINGSRRHYYLKDFGYNIFKACSPDSALILDTKLFDEYGSSAGYVQTVQGSRKDITLIARSRTMFADIYDPDIHKETAGCKAVPVKLQEERFFERFNGDVYYAAMDRQTLPAGSYSYAGLLQVRKAAYPDIFPFFTRREFFEDKEVLKDYPTRLLCVHYPYFKGKRLLEDGNEGKARLYFWSCRYYGWDMEWLLYNIGSLYSRIGDYEQAEVFFMDALYLDPFFPETYAGLGFVFFQKAEYDRAEESYQKAVSLNPNFSEAYYNLAVTQLRLGKKDSAAESFNIYHRFHPEDKPEIDRIGT